MLEVKIPKEITEYKEKIVFGLSARQLLFLGISVVVAIGTFIITNHFKIPLQTASYIVVIPIVPLLALGFLRKDGRPFEDFAVQIIRHYINPQKKRYQNIRERKVGNGSFRFFKTKKPTEYNPEYHYRKKSYRRIKSR